MKKLIVIFTTVVAILVGTSIFINSTYFFNRYIANTIKDYGFSYDRVDGALLSGFSVDNLKYKGEVLSSNVELRFNPIKLLVKKVSINKLRLIAVREDVLEKLINDFKPQDDSSSKTEIALNFELKDVLLTIKPFYIEGVKVIKNALSVDYITYINNKFNIGRVDYQAKTELGNVVFTGKYEKRVLYIDSITLENFNLNRFIPLLNQLQDKNSDSNSTEIPNPFIPKIVKVKEANLNLSPFKIEDISSKDLKIEIKDGLFDVSNVKLNKANIDFKYSSDLANLKANIFFDKKNLKVKQLNVEILKTQKLKDILSKLDTNNTKQKPNSLSILDINSIDIEESNLKVNKFILKKEQIDSININSNKLHITLNKKELSAKSLKLDINSSLIKANLEANIDNTINIENVKLYSSNIDKLLSILDTNKTDSNSSKTTITYIPNNFYIKKALIKGNHLSFEPFKIKDASIKASNIKGTLDKLSLSKGNLNAKVTSNWGTAQLNGYIKSNNYYAKGIYKPKQNLLKEYSIPLIAKNIKPLNVDGRFGFEDLDINITLAGKDILKDIKDIDILSSKNRLKVNYNTGNTYWYIDAKVKSKYTGEAKLINTLTYYDKLEYYGKLIPKEINISKEIDKLFNNLAFNYKGNSDSINVKFKSNKLQGTLVSKDYKTGLLKIENRNKILIKELLATNNNLKKSAIKKVKIESLINFNKIIPLKGKALIKTDILNLKGKWSYDNNFKSEFITDLPKNSLIIKNYKNINRKLFKKLKLNLEASKTDLIVKLNNNMISLKSLYNYKTEKLNLLAKSNSLKLNCQGNLKELNIKFNSNSINKTIKDINSIYKIKGKPNLNGSLKVSAQLKNLKDLKIDINSPKLIYKNKKSTTKIEKLSLNANFSNNKLQINNYRFNYNNYKFYSNKIGVLKIDDNNIYIKQLWINNSLKVIGNYNLKNLKGKFKLNSSSFKIENQDLEVLLSLNNLIDVNGKKIKVSGKIGIIDGVIKKSLKQKNVADNEDIIILQRQAQKKSTNFAKNIKLNLTIFSKKGILYKQDGSYFVLKPNLTIRKEFNKLSIFKGKIDLKKGGYYTLNGKRLKLQKGSIVFKGRSSTPNINIVMFYKGREYEVTINISGTPTRPILYFSSNPPLTKDQILAYLLFDDSTAAGTHSQEAMLNLIGGTLAKSFLGTIGIKIDHISIKENGFSIGKSLGDHIMIYYNQDGEKASVKTRVDIAKSVHTEIEIKEESQSADIIFSKEY